MSPSPHRYRGTHSIQDETCDRIHAAVRQLHQQLGWGKFSRLDLAKYSGLATSTVYAYTASLTQLTLRAYDEECRKLIEGCRRARTPLDLMNALSVACERRGHPIAEALNPAVIEPWQDDHRSTDDHPLSFENLAARLGELIKQADDEITQVAANDRARAVLYGFLSAVVAEDYGAISAIEL